MTANYHFHIHNFVSVSHSQIQNHSQGAELHTAQKTLDTNTMKEVLFQLQQLQEDLKLDTDNEQGLTTDIKTIHSQLGLKKPRASIIKDCFHSIKIGLEGAASHVLVADVIAKINALLSSIK